MPRVFLLIILVNPTLSFAQMVSKGPTPWKVYQEWPFSAEEAKRRQEETAKALGIPLEKKFDLGNGVSMELVLIPAGRFMMGTPEPQEPDWNSLRGLIQKGQGFLILGGLWILILLLPVLYRSIRRWEWPRVSLARLILIYLALSMTVLGGTGWWDGDRKLSLARGEFEAAQALYAEATDEEKPSQAVVIREPFYMGKYEVTQEEWLQVMKDNPSYARCSRMPVDQVSWNDTQTFIEKVKGLTGQDVRLPYNAEWEQACRAGTSSRFHSGEGDTDLAAVGWYESNSEDKMHLVGLKSPNGFGLFDMHGNAWEWCHDYLEEKNNPSEPVSDPAWPSPESLHYLRGGAWNLDPGSCRSASCFWCYSDYRGDAYGFRVVVSIPPTQKASKPEKLDRRGWHDLPPCLLHEILPGRRPRAQPREAADGPKLVSLLLFAGPGIRAGRTDAFAYLFDVFPTVRDGRKKPGRNKAGDDP